MHILEGDRIFLTRNFVHGTEKGTVNPLTTSSTIYTTAKGLDDSGITRIDLFDTTSRKERDDRNSRELNNTMHGLKNPKRRAIGSNNGNDNAE